MCRHVPFLSLYLESRIKHAGKHGIQPTLHNAPFTPWHSTGDQRVQWNTVTQPHAGLSESLNTCHGSTMRELLTQQAWPTVAAGLANLAWSVCICQQGQPTSHWPPPTLSESCIPLQTFNRAALVQYVTLLACLVETFVTKYHRYCMFLIISPCLVLVRSLTATCLRNVHCKRTWTSLPCSLN